MVLWAWILANSSDNDKKGVVACLLSYTSPLLFCLPNNLQSQVILTADLFSPKSSYLICVSVIARLYDLPCRMSVHSIIEFRYRILYIHGIQMIAQQKTSNSYFEIQIVLVLCITSFFFSLSQNFSSSSKLFSSLFVCKKPWEISKAIKMF